MLKSIYFSFSDPISTILLGLTVLFIQNLGFAVLDVIVFILPPELSSIVVIGFFALLWIDILGCLLLSLGLLRFSKLVTKNSDFANKIGFLMLIWALFSIIVRVLLNMNTGFPIVTDNNIIILLFFAWTILSLYFSIILIFLIKYFRYFSPDHNFLIPKIYVGTNIISVVLVGIGLLAGQSLLSIISSDPLGNDLPVAFYSIIALFILGALAKMTLVPLFGLITFYSFRTLVEEEFDIKSNKHDKNQNKTTYKPKKSRN